MRFFATSWSQVGQNRRSRRPRQMGRGRSERHELGDDPESFPGVAVDVALFRLSGDDDLASGARRA